MKLRQKLTMGLCAFYLITVIGVALNMHFCGGRLAEVSFSETAKCGKCKTAEKAGADSDCCKNTSVEAKVKDTHKAESSLKLAHDYGIELFFGTLVTKAYHTLSTNVYNYTSNKAPPLSAVFSLHLINCIFRN